MLELTLYPKKTDVVTFLTIFCAIAGLQLPDEQLLSKFPDEENMETILKMRLFWNLKDKSFNAEALLREIIRADFGGLSELVSSVYFFDTNANILFHLYDDRGADLVAENKETLSSIYEEFNDWILYHDRERIDDIFAK